MLPADRCGSGPPLVLVHEIGGARTSWQDVVPLLTGRHDVLVPDLPGHGAAAPAGADVTPAALAEALAATLDATGWQRPHLAGTSLGAWVALELAVQGRAASVTAISPAGLWTELGTGLPGAARVTRTQAAARAVRPLLPVLSRVRAVRHRALAGSVAHPERVAPRLFADVVRAVAVSVAYAPLAATLRGFRLPPELAAVTCPVTVAFGAADAMPDCARETALLPSHARLVTLPDAGHVAHWDDPAGVAELILATTGA